MQPFNNFHLLPHNSDPPDNDSPDASPLGNNLAAQLQAMFSGGGGNNMQMAHGIPQAQAFGNALGTDMLQAQLMQQQSTLLALFQQLMPMIGNGALGNAMHGPGAMPLPAMAPLGSATGFPLAALTQTAPTPTSGTLLAGTCPVQAQDPQQSTAVFERDARGWLIVKKRNREDFPLIPFWEKIDYTNRPPSPTRPGQKKRKRGPSKDPKENRTMRYVFTADGVMIDGIRARQLRRAFYKFCIYLEGKGRLPDTWATGIDPEMEAEYNLWMDSQFEECQAIGNHWIAREIAVRNFTQWRKKRLARKERLANPRKRTKTSRNPVREADDDDSDDDLFDEDEDEYKDDDDVSPTDFAGADANILGEAQFTISPRGTVPPETPGAGPSRQSVPTVLGFDIAMPTPDTPASTATAADAALQTVPHTPQATTPGVSPPRSSSPPSSPASSSARTTTSSPTMRGEGPSVPFVPIADQPRTPPPSAGSSGGSSDDAPRPQPAEMPSGPCGSLSHSVNEGTSMRCAIPSVISGFNFGNSLQDTLQIPGITPADFIRPDGGDPPDAASAKGGRKKNKGGTSATSRGDIPWPPVGASIKLKENCAYIWYRQSNNAGVYADFDKWYKSISHYARTKYSESNGNIIVKCKQKPPKGPQPE